MIRLNLQEAADAMQAAVLEPTGAESCRQQPMPNISIDSRTLSAGECFVAIRGAHRDGHDFVSEALQAGARVVIHSQQPPKMRRQDRCCFLRVADTTVALQALAHYVRKKWNRPVLAITGSAGKTTTRQFAATLLEEKYTVLQSPRNFNNEYGVPLSLLGLSEATEVAVLELGMNRAGEIHLLSRICAPNVALITNVAPVHLEFFSGVEEIAAAKGEILDYLAQDGLLLYNADDPQVSRIADGFQGEKTSFGIDRPADIQIGNYHLRDLSQMTFELDLKGHQTRVLTPFSGKHYLYNIAAAAAAALALGVAPQEISEGLAKLRPGPGRGRVLKLLIPDMGAITLLDDTYNSNPLALGLLLQSVASLEAFPERILALGAMLELGEASPELHRRAGQAAATCNPRVLIAVGEQGQYLLEGAQQAGLPSRCLHLCSTSEEAVPLVLQHLKSGDLLLCKGSRGIRMDRIVAEMLSRAERGHS